MLTTLGASAIGCGEAHDAASLAAGDARPRKAVAVERVHACSSYFPFWRALKDISVSDLNSALNEPPELFVYKGSTTGLSTDENEAMEPSTSPHSQVLREKLLESAKFSSKSASEVGKAVQTTSSRVRRPAEDDCEKSWNNLVLDTFLGSNQVPIYETHVDAAPTASTTTPPVATRK